MSDPKERSYYVSLCRVILPKALDEKDAYMSWKNPDSGNYVTRLEVDFEPSGRVRDARVIETSGIERVDAIVREAFAEAEGLPPPPSSLLMQNNLARLRFDFKYEYEKW